MFGLLIWILKATLNIKKKHTDYGWFVKWVKKEIQQPTEWIDYSSINNHQSKKNPSMLLWKLLK